MAADQAYRRPVLLDHHLLLLVTVGHGTHEVDFRTHPCRPGTLIWARPGQVVRYGGQPGLDAIVVCWDGAALAELDTSGASTAAFGPAYWQLAGEDEDAVINEVSQLVVDCQRHRSGERAADLLRHQLAVLLLRLALLPAAERYPAGAPGPGPGGTEPALGTFHRLREEVERSYGRTRRVEDYAERLRCSVRTLTRACLAVTGRSGKQVIDDRVTLQAMRLLAATDAPIADIGRRLGFPEPTNFGRFFHREVGQSPGAFRAGLGSGGRQRLPEQRGPVRPAAFTPFEGGPLP
ncbi:AraC family transcriptional regulator [Micromonospora sp. NPDC049559]|uniref:helix-turn-helix transcriptional regulator n=1 Tax=Micromonospora sp. NPDC049559 TaxID=3155923 RepID=UPI0034495CCB